MLTGTAYLVMWAGALAYAFHATSQSRGAGWAGTIATIAAWALLTAELVLRGLAAGHSPMTNRYEFALWFTWAILAAYLLLEIRWKERRGGAFVLLIALMITTFAVTRPASERALGPLPPVLRSSWLQRHVFAATLGYGAFGVAAGLGVMRLVRGDSPNMSPAEADWLPPADEINRAIQWAVGAGFPCLSLAILTGAIWAQRAWGRYWGWDPKETWALVTWLWYLMLLHLRAMPRWRERRIAALVIIGFGLVLFTYVGVPWLARTVRLPTLHGY